MITKLKSHFKSYAIKPIEKIIPAKIISTFFGVGYLPTWQEHWAAFLSLLLSYILFYIFYGLSYLNAYGLSSASLAIAFLFVRIALVTIILAMIAIPIFQKKNESASSTENIMVHIAFSQVLVTALTIPAVVSIYYNLSKVYNGICVDILSCPLWLNHFVYFFIFFMIPYAFFNLVIVIKPWPISFLQLNYNNCFSILTEGIVYVIYTMIFLYLVAFIFSDLTLIQAVHFIKYLLIFL